MELTERELEQVKGYNVSSEKINENPNLIRTDEKAKLEELKKQLELIKEDDELSMEELEQVQAGMPNMK